MTARIAAVVLAGGSGTRFGHADNKVYLPLAGRRVITWSLTAMADLSGLARLLLVTRPGDREVAAAVLAAELPDATVELVDGGSTRHDSEYHALRHLAPAIGNGEIDVVLIHDGARPLATPDLAHAVVEAASRHGGAVPGLPAPDLVEVDAHGTVRRRLGADHVRMQTPQAFVAAPLLAAYEAAIRDGFAGTDTASCVQHYRTAAVHWVPGEADNIKVTLPADLAAAEEIVRRRAPRP